MEAHPGGFIHLPIDQHGSRQYAGIFHFVPQFVAFPHAFTHAGKHRYALMQRADRVHEFHHQYRLADTGAADQSGFTALHKRA